jgi:hypothetical protein
MRRRITIALTLLLPLAVPALAIGTDALAKPPTAAAPAAAAPSAPPSASAAASSAAASPSGAASAASAAPAASGSSADTTPGAPKPAATNGATFSVKLHDLEQKVDDLQDQIRRSHTRLTLISESVLGGAGGSRAEVEFKNEMSSAFLLTRALFVVDGQVQYSRQDDSGALAEQKDIPIYSGSMPAGDHTINVALTFQGNGYGVFSYLRGYKFEVKSSHAYTAADGKAMSIVAIAFEKGGVTTPLEQRPAIQWQEKAQGLGSVALPASSAPAGGGEGAKK